MHHKTDRTPGGGWTARTLSGFLVATTLMAVPAGAQSIVAYTNIEAGDVLDEAPAAFEIRFTRDILLEQARLEDGWGETLDLPVAAPSTRQSQFVIPLPQLRDGDYVISWRGSGAENGVASGHVDFVVVVGHHDHSEHDHSDHDHSH